MICLLVDATAYTILGHMTVLLPLILAMVENAREVYWFMHPCRDSLLECEWELAVWIFCQYSKIVQHVQQERLSTRYCGDSLQAVGATEF